MTLKNTSNYETFGRLCPQSRLMMKRIIAIVIFIAPLYGLAQPIVLSGKITDEQTKLPLSFATILVQGRADGTVSNGDGEFDLIVPQDSGNDTLLISMMGYDTYRSIIRQIQHSGAMLVNLKPRPIELKEVVISEKKVSPREIVLTAFKDVKNNFLKTPYVMKGFYRETYLEDGKAVLLTEVAIDVYDKGYTTHDPEKVDVRSIRTSMNYRNDCFKKTVVERYNLLVTALRCNPIKYQPPYLVGNLKKAKFRIDSVVYLNDRPVYVISYFTYIARFPLFERKNTVCIDAENHIIYKYGWDEYATQGKYSEKAWRLSQDSPYLISRRRISTIYEYGSYEGKMGLKYYDSKCYDDILNASDGSVALEALNQETWVITGVDTKNVDSNHPETLRRDQSLNAQAKQYDPAFWKNYKEVKLVPLTRKDVKNLEKEMTLEKQFGSSK